MSPSVSDVDRWWKTTRPVPRRKAEALARRRADLPPVARTVQP
jgi:hypothetical protein